jgi:hypothetical protein
MKICNTIQIDFQFFEDGDVMLTSL